MKVAKGINLNTVLMVAGGVVVGVFLINRFTESGLAGFGKAPPAK